MLQVTGAAPYAVSAEASWSAAKSLCLTGLKGPWGEEIVTKVFHQLHI